MNTTNIVTFLEWSDSHGIWDLTSVVILLISAIAGFALVLVAKRRVRNLNFFFRPRRDWVPNYSSVIQVEIRNFTGRTVVISNPYFRHAKLRPDGEARGDSASGDYEIKFPRHLGARELDQVEFMLRHGETVSTWVPIDPDHSDEEVATAMRRSRAGKIRCTCTWLFDQPKIHRLVRKVGRPTIA